ncbi:hypothetical protein TIFTF001_012350 [Ficus carica]|uniref:Uncharacterized protein n=1 Tax=Ficus carica TaxID=3494 RepID=A0AA87ZTA1_FICCA|nr:hypothetical protein TIFTF001_012350 [Ficus carica]
MLLIHITLRLPGGGGVGGGGGGGGGSVLGGEAVKQGQGVASELSDVLDLPFNSGLQLAHSTPRKRVHAVAGVGQGGADPRLHIANVPKDHVMAVTTLGLLVSQQAQLFDGHAQLVHAQINLVQAVFHGQVLLGPHGLELFSHFEEKSPRVASPVEAYRQGVLRQILWTSYGHVGPVDVAREAPDAEVRVPGVAACGLDVGPGSGALVEGRVSCGGRGVGDGDEDY